MTTMTPDEVRAARAAYGLTCTELASVLDVSERTVRRWESNHPTHPNGQHEREIRALDQRIDSIAADLTSGVTTAEDYGHTPRGMIRVAQWRAYLARGAHAE